MNVIEIQNLIKQIGGLELRFNKNEQTFLLNGENVININKNKFEAIRDAYRQKMATQLSQKSDGILLKTFLGEISKFIQNLNNDYHSYRIKTSKSKYKNINSESERQFIKICQIINFKIDILEEIKHDLQTKLKYFDYKLDSDFKTFTPQNLETPFEDKESETGILKDRIDNPFPNIFRNYDAYLFFERLKENICTDQTTQLADYSYVYRKMLQDKFINDEVSPSSFVSFLDKNYTIVLDPLKSWGKLTGKHREVLYEILKTKSS